MHTAMLLDDNVVAQRETKTRPFAGWLRRKEGMEHLFLHVGRNAGAAVTDPDLHAVAEVFGCGSKGGLITIPIALGLTLRPPAQSRWKSNSESPLSFPASTPQP